MATTKANYGFRPVQSRSAAPYTGKMTAVIFLDTDATACFNGDLVKYTGASKLDTATGQYLPVVTQAAAADTKLAGAICGFYPGNSDDGYLNYRKASTQRIAYIPADRDVLYSVQEDGDTTPIADASIGLNVDFVVGTGDTTTGISGSGLDSDTVATTAALPLRVVNVENLAVDNDGDYRQFIVSINQDAYINTTGV